MTDHTAAERKRRQRERQRLGLARVEVWVPKGDVGELRTFAYGLLLAYVREFSQFQHVGPISFAENAQNGRATAKPETTR